MVPIILGVLSMSSLYAVSSHPVLNIYKKYHTVKEKNAISPYIICIYALDILKNTEETKLVYDFILWYAEHSNKIDRFGVSGTIYDFDIYSTGKESALKSYDSADGYAGMYLYLVTEYYKRTHDRELLSKIWDLMKDSAYLLIHLQDADDGLTKALPQATYKTKYLMDNVESFMGAASFLYLAKQRGVPAKEYLAFKLSIKEAIFEELYNKEDGAFYWSKEGDMIKKTNNNTFYPDIFARIHMLAFWGDELESDIAMKLWYEIRSFFDNNKVILPMEQIIIFDIARAFALRNNL